MILALSTLPATKDLEAKFGGDVRMLAVSANLDDRGRLVEFDFSAVPFSVRRVFTVTDVPAGVTRGGHSHRGVEQLLVCVSGRVEVELRRDDARHELELTPETRGLYVGPGVWGRQRYLAEGTALVVLASEPFDPASYETGYRG